MLTSREQEILSELVLANIGDPNEVEEFNFTVVCDNCSNEQIDILDQLCADPKKSTQIGEFLWISVRYSVVNSRYEISGECM